MEDMFTPEYAHFPTNYTARQNIQVTQVLSGAQSLPSNNLVLMIVSFYGIPVTLLIVMVIVRHLIRKIEFIKDVERLGKVAQLERILSLKSSKKGSVSDHFWAEWT
ncbi:hypothetical protein IQ254_16840 [Nodosilinea sp. LEGE 07088]|uniref:hypothetical protein n=1 Tax=Nodosilinea sp. LEGE 07088 TaxID=2777968 RepID=UPI00188262F6|nr:hypothetical protein [Nodosilinea sp. LEGE 07088]MBE9138841.1 hypothetical protein [Nodosilinea sp. LEGE 07088]